MSAASLTALARERITPPLGGYRPGTLPAMGRVESAFARQGYLDAGLLALCAELRDLQTKWQRLWNSTSEDWGLDAPPITPADHEWLAFNDNVWPAIHISGQSPRHPDDLPGLLLDFHPTTVEGIRAKAAAVLAMEDAAGYGGDCRNDSCELTHSVLVDMAGAARMLLGEEASPGNHQL